MVGKISRYVFMDVMRSKMVIAYALFLFAISFSLFQLEENPGKAMMSLLTIVLIVVPLVSLVFTTIHWYNSYEFIELMLTQPIKRGDVFLSEFTGLAVSLSLAFLAGVGIPIFINNPDSTGMAMIAMGLMLTLIFTSIAFLASVSTRDKATGIGASLMLWFYFAIIYDGIVLMILFSFSDYPLDKITLVLAALNPIDLGRIFLMLQMDISALMGYTGATYKEFLGSGTGMIFTFSIMMLWTIIPVWLAKRIFRKKDL